jgi:uncharacterized protein YcfJ
MAEGGAFFKRAVVSATSLNARGSELPLEVVCFVVAALRFCHDFSCGRGTLVYFGIVDVVGRFIVSAVAPQNIYQAVQAPREVCSDVVMRRVIEHVIKPV